MRTISPIWRPTVCTGFSAVSGSWKIIAISPPRTVRMLGSFGLEEIVALPRTLPPPTIAARSGCRPRMLIAVTDLPEPDSPTMREHLAARDVEADAVDRLHDAVVGVEADAAGRVPTAASRRSLS